MTTDLTAQEIDELKRLHQVPLNVPNARYDFSMAAYRFLPRLLAMVERLQVEVTAARLSTEGETELAKHYMDERDALRRQIADKDAVINDLRSDLKTRIDDVRNIAARYRDETGLDPFGDK